jgi:hypothetical protein
MRMFGEDSAPGSHALGSLASIAHYVHTCSDHHIIFPATVQRAALNQPRLHATPAPGRSQHPPMHAQSTLDVRAIGDGRAREDNNDAGSDHVAIGLLIQLIKGVLIADGHVAADARVLVDDGVLDDAAVADAHRYLALCDEGSLLLFALIVVSAHDHRVSDCDVAPNLHTPNCEAASNLRILLPCALLYAVSCTHRLT